MPLYLKYVDFRNQLCLIVYAEYQYRKLKSCIFYTKFAKNCITRVNSFRQSLGTECATIRPK
jgi:hypothetical protein